MPSTPDALRATIADLATRWQLTIGEEFEPGATAWVAAASTADNPDLVLKIVRSHPEAADEAEGLRCWDGDGAVRIYAADDVGDAVALLVERCRPGFALSTRPEWEQDEVIAGLLRRLWVHPPAPHRFRPLEEMCGRWADEFDIKVEASGSSLDPGLAKAGIELFRCLPGTADQRVLMCTDLHAGNVLAAEREPWLVIDPKPYVGDPTYDVTQHMLNCPGRLDSDPVSLLNRMADLTGLDRERTRLWLFARCVQESPDWPGLADVARQITP